MAFLLLLPTMAAVGQPLRSSASRAPSLLALNRQIAASADDASQYGGPSSPINPLSLSLLLGDNTVDPFTNGFRFENISVPQYATITQASLLFTAFSDEAGSTTLTIHGHNAGNSPTFAPGNGPADRAPNFTSASVPWNPTDWSSGSMYQTPDITAIIQEIVDRGDWASGAALSLIVEDDGALNGIKRKATAYDWIPAQAAQISIEYVENAGATSPVSPPGSDGGAAEEPAARVPAEAAGTDGRIPGNFLINPAVFYEQAQAIPAPPPDLIITSLTTNQGGYLVGQTYQIEVEVRNNGSTSAGSFQIGGEIGRFVIESETSGEVQFASSFVFAGAPGLGAGESIVLTSSPRSFDELPPDAVQHTDSELSGFPNNGTVLFRANVDVTNTVEESHENNNMALTAAIYPTGAANSSYDASLDADGDGWMVPDDCDDNDARTYPGAYEYNDTTDSDCNGVDEGVTGEGLSGFGGFANIGLIYGDPAMWIYLFKSENDLDLDQDGYPISQDCNDFNSAQNPGAAELPDGIDNDCDGLIDEGYVTPDFAFVNFQMSRSFYACDEESCGISYELDLEYASGDIGSFALLQAEDAVQIKDFSGQIFAIGREGFIPYSQFPSYAYAESMACDSSGLMAILPGSAYGEENLDNNWTVAYLENLGGPDFDIRFDDNDFIQEITRDFIRIRHESLAGGSCPPRDLIDYMVRTSVDVDGARVFETEQLIHNADNPFIPAIQHDFNSRIHGGDEIRIEIQLNSDGRHNENTSNNLCIIEGTFRRPFHMDVLSFSAGFDTHLEITSSQGCDLSPGQTQQGLTAGPGFGGFNPVLVGLVGLILAGAGAGTVWSIGTRLAVPNLAVLVVAPVIGIAVGGIGIIGLSSIGAGADTDSEQVLPSASSDSAAINSDGTYLVDVVARGPFTEPVRDDLWDNYTCSDYIDSSHELVVGSDGLVEEVLLHLSPGQLVQPNSRPRVTFWGEDGIPRIFVTEYGTVSVGLNGFYPPLGNHILWQVIVETNLVGGGDLFQSACIPNRMQVIDIPETQLPSESGREFAGFEPQYTCKEIISVSHRDAGGLLVNLSCPGIGPYYFPASVEQFDYTCNTDARFPNQLFCVGKSPPVGTEAYMRVWEFDGLIMFEGDFVVPSAAPTPVPQPTVKPTKPGPAPTKPSG